MKETEKKLEGTKFDPTKNYAWEKDTLFTLSGTEFALIFNHLNQFMKAPITIESGFKLLDISMVLQQKLAQAVESGEAKESKEFSPPQETL